MQTKSFPTITKQDFDVDISQYPHLLRRPTPPSPHSTTPATTNTATTSSENSGKFKPRGRKQLAAPTSPSGTAAAATATASSAGGPYPKFKHRENQYFEFKESPNTHPKGFQKYIETLCGFLNTGEGGYLIFGIKDDLDMLGIQMKSEKDIDAFICRLDAITSTGQILQEISTNNTCSNIANLSSGYQTPPATPDRLNAEDAVVITSPATSSSSISSVESPLLITDNPPSVSPVLVSKITPNTIRSTLYINNLQQRFLVVEACPTQGVKYQCANGMVYYRLGASNYFDKAERLYRQTEYELAIKSVEKQARTENKQNIDLFARTLAEKNRRIEELQAEIMRTSSQLIQTNELTSIYQTHLQNALKTLLPSYSQTTTTIVQANHEDSSLVTLQKVYENAVAWFFPCLSVGRSDS